MDKRSIKKEARELIQWAKTVNAEEYTDEDGQKVKSVFLGTVFSIMPSGKYYMPFACSNVELCVRCKGLGCEYCGNSGSREAYEDELMNEALDEYASKIGAYVTSGEGDSCDIFINWSIEEEEEEEEEE